MNSYRPGAYGACRREDHRNIYPRHGEGYPGREESPGNPVVNSHIKVQTLLSRVKRRFDPAILMTGSSSPALWRNREIPDEAVMILLPGSEGDVVSRPGYDV